MKKIYKYLSVLIIFILAPFVLNAQNCPGYSNTATGTGKACGGQNYTMIVNNTACNGQVFLTVKATGIGGSGTWQIISVLTNTVIASGTGNGTQSVGPINVGTQGNIFNLVAVAGLFALSGTVTVSQGATTVAQVAVSLGSQANHVFSASITISDVTMTVTTPSGPVTSVVGQCKNVIMSIPLASTNYCNPTSISLPWTITCNSTGAVLASGTHAVSVYPKVPADASDLVDITWNGTTCSWDVTPQNDCAVADIGTTFSISPDPSTTTECGNGNESFTVTYNGPATPPHCCETAGPATNITYNSTYTPGAPTATSSPYGGTNNAAHLNYPPNNTGGNATAFQVCVNVSNYCFNTASGDNSYYIAVFIDNVEVKLAGPFTATTASTCVNLSDLPNGYSQSSNLDIYVLPNVFSYPAGGTNTTFNPSSCSSNGNWTATITSTLTATYQETIGTPITCGFPLSSAYTSCGTPSATISYTGPFCSTETNPQAVTLTGTTGGTFSASPAGLSINASTGAITPSTSTAGTYTVTYTIPAGGGCGVVTVTTNVTISSNPVVNITAVPNQCSNGSAVTLNATPSGGTFSGNGVTGSSFNPATATVGSNTITYSVPASGSCPAALGTTTITVNKTPDAPIITIIPETCNENGKAIIDSLNVNYVYNFTPTGPTVNTSNGEILGLTPATNYTISATNNNCTSATSPFVINAQTGSNVAVSITPSQSVINEGSSVQLNCNINPYVPGSIYSWSPTSTLSCTDCPSPIASPPSDSNYYVVKVTTPDSCVLTASALVIVKINCGDLYIPNVFSPNGDNQNDIFLPRGRCIVKMSMKIFDRWGNKVFESTDYKVGWNGNEKGGPAQTGAYSYLITLTQSDGKVEDFHGSVDLIR